MAGSTPLSHSPESAEDLPREPDSGAQPLTATPPADTAGSTGTSTRRRWLGWGVAVGLCLCVVGVSFPDILPGSPPPTARPPFAQLIALRGPMAVGLAMVGFVLGIAALIRALRRKGGARTALVAVGVLVMAAVQAGCLAQRGVSNDESLLTGSAPAEVSTWDGTVTVVALNVLYSEADAGVLAQQIVRSGAVLLTPVGPAPAGGMVRPTVLGVHTHPPLTGLMSLWRSSVSGVVGHCAQGKMPPGLIVAGDLNSTADHALLRDLGGCADAGEQAGIGGLATWPTTSRTPLLGATIDHVLADRATWRARAGAVAEVPGTDHRAVVIELVPVEG